MKTICIIQPYVFPYLPYYQLASIVDEFWVLDDVQFIRRGWMNKNFILLNGEIFSFTIPVEKAKQSTLISEKSLSKSFDIYINRLKTTLYHAYNKSSSFNLVINMIEGLASKPWTNFLDFSIETIRLTFDCLKINTPILKTSSLNIENLHGQDRILKICKLTRTCHYINPIGGINLYDSKLFLDHEIKLSFLKGGFKPYLQIKRNHFIPGLSILDLIANLSPNNYYKHLNNYTLIQNQI
jgi:hypothetical protein